MACGGNIRDFFQLLAGTLVRSGSATGFNFTFGEADFDCDCVPVTECGVDSRLSDGFEVDACGSSALKLTRCFSDCWVLVNEEDEIFTSLSGDIIKIC